MFQQPAGQQAWQEAALVLTPNSCLSPDPPSRLLILHFSLPPPLLSLLPTHFIFSSPVCCISHPLCPLHLVPIPPDILSVIHTLSVSLSMSGHYGAE